MRRPFMLWISDTICGLLAYTMSRWIWQKDDGSVFHNLPQELATFAAFFVLLKLALKGLGLARKKKPA